MKKKLTTLMMTMVSAGICAQSIIIDTERTYQTIQDFGASDCWTTEYVSDYFSSTEKEKAAKWLFSKGFDSNGNPEGIGLSCWRVNVGAGSAEQGAASNIEDEVRRVSCYQRADGTYDWSRCNGQQWFMQKAKQYGVDHFLLFSNSAPVHMTKTGKANADNQNIACNLKDDCYDDFAEFLSTVAEHFAGEGYNITYIDPVNEPRFDWKDAQEGSPWDNNNIAQLARELDKSITERGLSAKILIPEASSWELTYEGTGRASNEIYAFFDRKSPNYIGNLPSLEKAIAGHSYWTFRTNADLKSMREKVRNMAARYQVGVMQTEWSMLDAAPETGAGFPASYEAASKMDIALYMGKVIHCDLCFGNMTGWSYWTAFSTERYAQKNRFYLIRMNAAGDAGDESYGNIKKGGRLTVDKNLWVLGNYSRFIRPGYKRVQLTGRDDLNGLMGTAWLSPDGNTLVAVLVNMAQTKQELSVSAKSRRIEGLKSYLTDKNYSLKLQPKMNDIGDLIIPERSVVTLVMTLEDQSSSSVGGITAPKHRDGRIYALDGKVAQNAGKGVIIENGRKAIRH